MTRRITLAGMATLLFLAGCGKLEENQTQPELMTGAVAHHYHGGNGGWWGWGGWGQAVTAWGDHLRFIGQARYLTAKANYENALAAEQWVRANAYLRLMRSMHQDFYRLERDKYKLNKERERLAQMASGLNGISVGKLKVSALSSLGWFSNLPGFTTLPLIKEGKQVGPFGPEQFITSPTRTRFVDGVRITEPVTVEGFSGGTIEEFLGWLRTRYYDVKVETSAAAPTAWQVLMSVRAELLNQVALTDAALKEEAKQDTADWLQIWGETALWSGYGGGLLKDYQKEVAAAAALGK